LVTILIFLSAKNIIGDVIIWTNINHESSRKLSHLSRVNIWDLWTSRTWDMGWTLNSVWAAGHIRTSLLLLQFGLVSRHDDGGEVPLSGNLSIFSNPGWPTPKNAVRGKYLSEIEFRQAHWHDQKIDVFSQVQECRSNK